VENGPLTGGHFFGWNGPSLAPYRWGRFFGLLGGAESEAQPASVFPYRAPCGAPKLGRRDVPRPAAVAPAPGGSPFNRQIRQCPSFIFVGDRTDYLLRAEIYLRARPLRFEQKLRARRVSMSG
jgi:hypothetical protein